MTIVRVLPKISHHSFVMFEAVESLPFVVEKFDIAVIKGFECKLVPLISAISACSICGMRCLTYISEVIFFAVVFGGSFFEIARHEFFLDLNQVYAFRTTALVIDLLFLANWHNVFFVEVPTHFDVQDDGAELPLLHMELLGQVLCVCTLQPHYFYNCMEFFEIGHWEARVLDTAPLESMHESSSVQMKQYTEDP